MIRTARKRSFLESIPPRNYGTSSKRHSIANTRDSVRTQQAESSIVLRTNKTSHRMTTSRSTIIGKSSLETRIEKGTNWEGNLEVESIRLECMAPSIPIQPERENTGYDLYLYVCNLFFKKCITKLITNVKCATNY